MAKAKEKMEVLVPAEEQPYPVPANWRWVRLGSAYEINPKNIAEDNTEAAFVPMEKISPGMDDLFSFEVQSWAKAKKGHTQFADGDVAFAKISPCFENHKSMTINGLPNGIGGGTTELIILRQKKINQKYTYWLINTEQFIKGGCATYSGTVGQQRISMDYVRNFPVPLPPYSEQIRIVARIESLFAKLDEAKEKAQAVVDGYEDRKAAILHKAFTGELTEKWRENNYKLLSEWENVEFGKLLEKIEAGKNFLAINRPPAEDEFGVVKVSAVTWGEFDENESKTCQNTDQWDERRRIANGDFLFSRANTIQLVGNCVIVRNIEKNLMISDKILRLHFVPTVNKEYVLQYTRSVFYRKQIEELASGNQDGMRNISQDNFRKIQIPIPSYEEQKCIADILSRVFESERLIKNSADKVIEQIDIEKKSILAKAFRGELGTNDPSEEPVDL